METLKRLDGIEQRGQTSEFMLFRIAFHAKSTLVETKQVMRNLGNSLIRNFLMTSKFSALLDLVTGSIQS